MNFPKHAAKFALTLQISFRQQAAWEALLIGYCHAQNNRWSVCRMSLMPRNSSSSTGKWWGKNQCGGALKHFLGANEQLCVEVMWPLIKLLGQLTTCY